MHHTLFPPRSPLLLFDVSSLLKCTRRPSSSRPPCSARSTSPTRRPRARHRRHRPQAPHRTLASPTRSSYASVPLPSRATRTRPLGTRATAFTTSNPRGNHCGSSTGGARGCCRHRRRRPSRCRKACARLLDGVGRLRSGWKTRRVHRRLAQGAHGDPAQPRVGARAVVRVTTR